MNEQKKIIDRVIKNSAEVITEEELRARLASGEKLTHYIGFEISGYVHIGQGLMTALVMKDLTDLGVQCTVWLADWHTAINEKLDGTKETAAKIGRGYFTEAIKASFLAVGGDPEKLEFRLASEWYEKNPMKYWETVLAVQENTTLSRMLRSIDIMGREAGESIESSKLIYPAMQAADIFYQNIDIAQAGMDQRKIHAIMRDVADKVVPNKPKPVVIHHPILDSLTGASNKMSKSKPDAAVFLHDSEEEIASKIKKAFCEEKNVENNPILNWTKNLLFWNRTAPFRIERKEEHGGDVEFQTYEELEQAFAAGDVHPMDLKATVSKELSSMLAPAREHFAKAEVAAAKGELDKMLKSR